MSTVDINEGGVIVPGVAIRGGYVPQAGDTVIVSHADNDPVVEGGLGDPGTQLVNEAGGDESGSATITAGHSAIIQQVPILVAGSLGTAPRAVLAAFGFMSSVASNSGGEFGVNVDGAAPALPYRRWHYLGGSGIKNWSWFYVVPLTPGQHLIELAVGVDPGGATMTWSFPRIDLFVLG